MSDIHKAAGIIIGDESMLVSASVVTRGKKLLVERSPGRGKNIFVAPGGKLEKDETHEQALVRELKEEMNIDVKESDIELFSVDEAEAANNPGQKVIMKTYLVKKWKGKIQPGAEVEELAWVTTKDIGRKPIGSIFEHSIMPELKKQDLID